MAVKSFWAKLLLQLLVITTLACIALIVYATYRVLSTSLKAVNVTKTGASPRDCHVVKTSDLPALLNGMSTAILLWPVEKFEERTVLAPGSGSRQFTGDSRTSANTLQYEFLRMGMGQIDYVPMNRWVHVTMVYREGAITFFMVAKPQRASYRRSCIHTGW
jgi:hypothetical protein